MGSQRACHIAWLDEALTCVCIREMNFIVYGTSTKQTRHCHGAELRDDEIALRVNLSDECECIITMND